MIGTDSRKRASRAPQLFRGWHQVAFTSEIEGDLTPAAIGNVPLVLVRRGGEIEAYDAVCPHRGAHLGYGGRLEGDAIICPFHGHRVRLGGSPTEEYAVKKFRTLEVGGLVFVLLSERFEHGLSALMERLKAARLFIPAFSLDAPVAPDLVIENAFDADHFNTVHGVSRRPKLRLGESLGGELTVEAAFRTPAPNPWQEPRAAAGPVDSRFVARAFSPTVVVAELGEEEGSHFVITAATPVAGGGCVIRVSLAVPRGEGNGLPDLEAVRSLVGYSRLAFEQDMPIWSHLSPDAPQRYAPGDEMIVRFREFCSTFVVDEP